MTFILPPTPTDAKPLPSSMHHGSDSSTGSTPLRIAVVDDHQPSRLAICRLLERQGYATCHFGSVAEFIRSEAKRTIACLISDVRMPEIDGIALKEVLQHTNFTFPVIFCTGQEIDDRLNRALTKGVSALLRKPVDGETLLQAVHAACTGVTSRPVDSKAPQKPRNQVGRP